MPTRLSMHSQKTDKAGSATNARAEPCTQSSTLPSGSSKPTRLPPEATAQPTLGPEGPRARPNKPHPDPSVRSKLLPGNKSGSSEPHGKPHEQQSGTGVQTQVGGRSSKTSRAAAQPTTSSVTAAQPTTSSVTAAQPTTSSVIVDPFTEPPPVTSDQPSSTASAEECALWPPLPPSDEDHRSSETSSSGSSELSPPDCDVSSVLGEVTKEEVLSAIKELNSGGKGLRKGGAKRHRKVLRDNIQGITKPAIRRLARRGGVKRISGLIYEETRRVLKVFLENVIRDAVTYTEHAKRKTVTAMDVVYALKRQGRT
uniref:Histone H4 n=1 Tax=Knipowitschia caucasica TaxID=637954 RepID=A0AAV2MTQ5_KNICA